MGAGTNQIKSSHGLRFGELDQTIGIMFIGAGGVFGPINGFIDDCTTHQTHGHFRKQVKTSISNKGSCFVRYPSFPLETLMLTADLGGRGRDEGYGTVEEACRGNKLETILNPQS